MIYGIVYHKKYLSDDLVAINTSESEGLCKACATFATLFNEPWESIASDRKFAIHVFLFPPH